MLPAPPSRSLLAKVLAAVLALWCSPALAEAEQIDGTVATFGQWAVGCDNRPLCTAVVPIEDLAGGQAPAFASFTFSRAIPDPQTAAFYLPQSGRIGLSPLAAWNLMQDLSDPLADMLVYRDLEGRRLQLPRAGFAAVLAALDDWRAQPAMRPPPRYDEVGSIWLSLDVDGLPDLDWQTCPPGHFGQSLQVWAGPLGQTVWRQGCGNEGLNPVSFWFIANTRGAAAQPVVFTDRGLMVEPNNAWFDAENGYLHMITYDGEYEDCGIARIYGWNSQGPELLERSEMPLCGSGIGVRHWIVTQQTAERAEWEQY